MTPEYIIAHWTEEKLCALFRARNKRLRRQNEADPKQRDPDAPGRMKVRTVKARRVN